MAEPPPENYQVNEDEEQNYRQELGLKKMLFKYEHQNEQLKAQIKALTQRLADITAKKDQPATEQKHIEPSQEYRLSLLKQEMKTLYSQIQKMNVQIKKNKEMINEYQELRCVELTNQIKKEDRQIQSYKTQIEKYERMQKMKGFAVQTMDLKQSSLRIGAHHQKLKQIQQELEASRKQIREMEKFRDQFVRVEIKKHSYAININSKTRALQNEGKQVPVREEPKQKKGIWNMDYTEQNYNKIRAELNSLRQEKQRIIQSLKNQNIVLKNRFAELSISAEQLNKSIHLPQLSPPRYSSKQETPRVSNNNGSFKINSSRINSPPRLLNIGPKEFQQNNDKNFSPKKLRKIEWESANYRTNGIEWNDAHLRSPINGINLWFDGSLIGIQFLHRMGESSQHLHIIAKNVSPVQYRLNANDYLQNVLLWISDNRIVGIELTSKAGRQDGFGNRGKGRKFDFSIKDPEKPVFSYGRFRITNNVSEITKLGFEAV